MDGALIDRYRDGRRDGVQRRGCLGHLHFSRLDLCHGVRCCRDAADQLAQALSLDLRFLDSLNGRLVTFDFGISENDVANALEPAPVLGGLPLLFIEFAENPFFFHEDRRGSVFLVFRRGGLPLKIADRLFEKFDFGQQPAARFRVRAGALGAVRRKSRLALRGSDLLGLLFGLGKFHPGRVGLALVLLLVPIVFEVSKIAPEVSQTLHFFEDPIALFLEIDRLGLDGGEPIACVLIAATRSARAGQSGQGAFNGLRDPLATHPTRYRADLRLQASLQCALGALVERRIPEGMPLADPKRTPDARFGATAIYGKSQEALKFGLGLFILEATAVRASPATPCPMGRRSAS